MSRFTLTPRAAVLLAVLVVVIALVIVVVGARSRDPGTVSVSGADPVGSGRPAPSASGTGAGSRAGAGAGAGSGSGGAGEPGSGASAPTSSGTPVVVHVVGAVGAPGLVTLASGARVADAVDRAGGAAADADLARVNLARPVVDGERLYVPRVGETDVPDTVDSAGGGTGAGVGVGASGAGGAPGGESPVVDLNTADQTTLETLPGIGPALAQRILAWRQEHGRFSSPQDLLEVSGIGEGRFAELESRVRV